MWGKSPVEVNNTDDHDGIIEKWPVSSNFDPGEAIATKCEGIWTLLEPRPLSGERMVTFHQCVHCNHYNHRATVAIVYDKGFPKSSMQWMHKEDTCGVQKSSLSTKRLSKQDRKHSIKQARWNETHLGKAKRRWAEDQWDTCNGWRWIARFNITSGRLSITISLPNKC